jgi:hypothetical protein
MDIKVIPVFGVKPIWIQQVIDEVLLGELVGAACTASRARDPVVLECGQKTSPLAACIFYNALEESLHKGYS